MASSINVGLSDAQTKRVSEIVGGIDTLLLQTGVPSQKKTTQVEVPRGEPPNVVQAVMDYYRRASYIVTSLTPGPRDNHILELKYPQ